MCMWKTQWHYLLDSACLWWFLWAGWVEFAFLNRGFDFRERITYLSRITVRFSFRSLATAMWGTTWWRLWVTVGWIWRWIAWNAMLDQTSLYLPTFTARSLNLFIGFSWNMATRFIFFCCLAFFFSMFFNLPDPLMNLIELIELEPDEL